LEDADPSGFCSQYGMLGKRGAILGGEMASQEKTFAKNMLTRASI
jgi:hypothetical protein